MSRAAEDILTSHHKNPFGDARVNSAYTAWRRGELVYPLQPERSPSALAVNVHDSFRAHMLAPEFSCLGGKAAINNNTYRFGFYAEMGAEAINTGLAHDLWEFVRERPSFGTEYATYVASFARPAVSDEQEWEHLLWSQLQSLHDLDSAHHGWDPKVSHDPTDPAFSFSFAETSFFVVGLHSASSRYARRFRWPTLVFNAHEQFEHLRKQNQFERLRETVRARDYKLQGSLNPNLSDFGEHSEARQYSGRAIEDGWQCPFRANVGSGDKSRD